MKKNKIISSTLLVLVSLVSCDLTTSDEKEISSIPSLNSIYKVFEKDIDLGNATEKISFKSSDTFDVSKDSDAEKFLNKINDFRFNSPFIYEYTYSSPKAWGNSTIPNVKHSSKGFYFESGNPFQNPPNHSRLRFEETCVKNDKLVRGEWHYSNPIYPDATGAFSNLYLCNDEVTGIYFVNKELDVCRNVGETNYAYKSYYARGFNLIDTNSLLNVAPIEQTWTVGNVTINVETSYTISTYENYVVVEISDNSGLFNPDVQNYTYIKSNLRTYATKQANKEVGGTKTLYLNAKTGLVDKVTYVGKYFDMCTLSIAELNFSLRKYDEDSVEDSMQLAKDFEKYALYLGNLLLEDTNQ